MSLLYKNEFIHTYTFSPHVFTMSVVSPDGSYDLRRVAIRSSPRESESGRISRSERSENRSERSSIHFRAVKSDLNSADKITLRFSGDTGSTLVVRKLVDADNAGRLDGKSEHDPEASSSSCDQKRTPTGTIPGMVREFSNHQLKNGSIRGGSRAAPEEGSQRGGTVSDDGLTKIPKDDSHGFTNAFANDSRRTESYVNVNFSKPDCSVFVAKTKRKLSDYEERTKLELLKIPASRPVSTRLHSYLRSEELFSLNGVCRGNLRYFQLCGMFFALVCQLNYTVRSVMDILLLAIWFKHALLCLVGWYRVRSACSRDWSRKWREFIYLSDKQALESRQNYQQQPQAAGDINYGSFGENFGEKGGQKAESKEADKNPEDNITSIADSFFHIIILPNYKEDLVVMAETVNKLSESILAKQSLAVLIACELREGDVAFKKADLLLERFQHKFRVMACALHPKDLPGEVPGKGSNAAWAFHEIRRWFYSTMKPDSEQLKMYKAGIYHTDFSYRMWEAGVFASQFENDPSKIFVHNADIDTLYHPDYFTAVSLQALRLTPEGRKWTGFSAPIYCLRNFGANLPFFCRSGASAGMTYELASLELSSTYAPYITYSTYTMNFVLLDDLHVQGWDPDFLTDDWHMYFRCFFASLWDNVSEIQFSENRVNMWRSDISKIIRKTEIQREEYIQNRGRTLLQAESSGNSNGNIYSIRRSLHAEDEQRIIVAEMEHLRGSSSSGSSSTKSSPADENPMCQARANKSITCKIETPVHEWNDPARTKIAGVTKTPSSMKDQIPSRLTSMMHSRVNRNVIPVSRFKVKPIWLPNNQMSVEGSTYLESAQERWTQALRHSWGAVEMAYFLHQLQHLQKHLAFVRRKAGKSTAQQKGQSTGAGPTALSQGRGDDETGTSVPHLGWGVYWQLFYLLFKMLTIHIWTPVQMLFWVMWIARAGVHLFFRYEDSNGGFHEFVMKESSPFYEPSWNEETKRVEWHLRNMHELMEYMVMHGHFYWSCFVCIWTLCIGQVLCGCDALSGRTVHFTCADTTATEGLDQSALQTPRNRTSSKTYADQSLDKKSEKGIDISMESVDESRELGRAKEQDFAVDVEKDPRADSFHGEKSKDSWWILLSAPLHKLAFGTKEMLVLVALICMDMNPLGFGLLALIMISFLPSFITALQSAIYGIESKQFIRSKKPNFHGLNDEDLTSLLS